MLIHAIETFGEAVASFCDIDVGRNRGHWLKICKDRPSELGIKAAGAARASKPISAHRARHTLASFLPHHQYIIHNRHWLNSSNTKISHQSARRNDFGEIQQIWLFQCRKTGIFPQTQDFFDSVSGNFFNSALAGYLENARLSILYSDHDFSFFRNKIYQGERLIQQSYSKTFPAEQYFPEYMRWAKSCLQAAARDNALSAIAKESYSDFLLLILPCLLTPTYE